MSPFFKLRTILLLAIFSLSVIQCSSNPKPDTKENSETKEPTTTTTESATDRAANVDGSSGCLTGDCNNGAGTYVWADGSKYVGEWRDGKRDGSGTYLWASGDKYAGQFKDGDCEGTGIYTWVNGAKYSGAWKAGKIHGKGTYNWESGNTTTSQFENHAIKTETKDEK